MSTPQRVRLLANECETHASWLRNVIRETDRVAWMAIMKNQHECAAACRQHSRELEDIAICLDKASDMMREEIDSDD